MLKKTSFLYGSTPRLRGVSKQAERGSMDYSFMPVYVSPPLTPLETIASIHEAFSQLIPLEDS